MQPPSGPGYAAGALDARVEFGPRFKRGLGNDWACLGVFLAGVAAYLAIGLFLVANANASIVDGQLVFEESLIIEKNTCTPRQLAGTSGRLLDAAQCTTLWCIFEHAIYIPVVTILCVPLIGTLWIVCLYFFTHVMTWIGVLFNCVMYLLIGVAFIIADNDLSEIYGTDESSDLRIVGILFIAFSVVIALVLFCTRNQIIQASRHLKTATMALSKNVLVFAVTFCIQALVLLTLGLHWFFLMRSSLNFEVDPITCSLVQTSLAIKSTWFMSFMLLWILSYFNSAKLITTAMVVGSWFFGQEDRPDKANLAALQTSLTASAGANAVGGLITAVVEYILSRINHKLWWSDPLGCLLKCLYLMAQSCIMAVTRFATIAHAFTGEDFFSSSRRSFDVLKRNFVGGYVTSRVGISVVGTFVNSLSLCVGLLAWHWIDAENGWNTLQDVLNVFGGLIGCVAFVILYLYLVRIPLFTLLAITLLMEFVSGSSLFTAQVFAPIGGIFVSCVAAIILRFQGDVVLDALDTIFMAYAVANDTGLALKSISSEHGKIYEMMSEDVPEAKPFLSQNEQAIAHAGAANAGYLTANEVPPGASV
mmetsp:Transcript_22766/g.72945  ORF Transcript_22766/g.72945 Transcript_22766/m.72945 type:complete len:590 (-) Transcript_22766:50-1819(-)